VLVSSEGDLPPPPYEEGRINRNLGLNPALRKGAGNLVILEEKHPYNDIFLNPRIMKFECHIESAPSNRRISQVFPEAIDRGLCQFPFRRDLQGEISLTN